jgi:dTDP-4-amino-4,6-dideoxygalactose transaminase
VIRRSTFLPFSLPVIEQEELQSVRECLESGWLTTGPRVAEFERAFVDLSGASAAVAVSSCTHAMELALAVHDIGAGDEVITTAMTFASTVNVIERAGATPVLVDVMPDTLTIDPEAVRRAITPRTRAILPVHLYGHPCEMDELGALATRHGLHLIEDAAHALPSFYKGRMIGAGDSLTAFSFYATKNATTGEGGMLTGPVDLVDRARRLSLHGMSRNAIDRYSSTGSWFYEITEAGLKCNMTDLQAALGLPQLRRLPSFQARRRQIWDRYDASFRELGALRVPTVRNYVQHALHLYVVRVNPTRTTIGRDAFIEQLRQRNIGTSVHFIPIHLHKYYREKYGFRPGDYPVAAGNFEQLISLPLYASMTDEDVADVIAAVRDVVERP